MSAAFGITCTTTLAGRTSTRTAATRCSWHRSRPIADAQDPGERAHERLLVAAERGELRMRRLRLALAVVAGDLGDELDLAIGQSGELAVADHVVRVQVVLGVGDHEPDVGQQRTRLEVVTLRRAEAVQRLQAVEQFDGEACHLGRVFRIVVAPFEQLAHAATRHVAVASAAGRLAGQPLDGVEEHAVTQRTLAERHRLDVEPRDDLVEDQRAGRGDVGPVGLEPGELRRAPSGCVSSTTWRRSRATPSP